MCARWSHVLCNLSGSFLVCSMYYKGMEDDKRMSRKQASEVLGRLLLQSTSEQSISEKAQGKFCSQELQNAKSTRHRV